MRHINTVFFLFISVFSIQTAFCQRVEIGLNLGGAGYLGDFNQFNPVKISGLSGGVFAKYNIDHHWGLGIYYQYGKIKADDASSSSEQLVGRNLSFFTPLNELSIITDFNLFDLFTWGANKKRLTPYLFAGVGLVNFVPKTKFAGDIYELNSYATEGQAVPYKNTVLSFPYGAGIKYRLTETLTFRSQIGYRTASTDYLDDVSGFYPEKTYWSNNQIGTATLSRLLSDRSGEQTGVYIGQSNTQRGDFRKRDNYMFVGIGISYTFVSQKCFSF